MRFLDDYFGEPAHDGLSAQPGVMARLVDVEKAVTSIKMEVHPNRGTSMKDSVNRTERSLGELRRDVDNLTRKVDNQATNIDELRGRK
jgi:hypothetical protein